MDGVKKKSPYLAEYENYLAEWDFKKNNELNLDPRKLTIGSGKLAYWICPEQGHSWPAKIIDRTGGNYRKGTKCPYCQKFTSKVDKTNCLAATHPHLLEEWDYELNEKLGFDPKSLSFGSDKRAGWICKNNPTHRWRATIGSRTTLGVGCKSCGSQGIRKVPVNRTLKALFPELSLEWHPYENICLPHEIGAFSHKKAHWQCAEGHIWEESIASRSTKLLPCKFCAERCVTAEKSFAAYHDDLLDEWDFEKNIISPFETAPKSGLHAWWQCKEENHSWRAVIASRTVCGNNCPYCASRGGKVSYKNSFSTRFPQLVIFWNYKKNQPIEPHLISYNSNQLVSWECPSGHWWEETVSNFVVRGCCLFCKQDVRWRPSVFQKWLKMNEPKITSSNHNEVIQLFADAGLFFVTSIARSIVEAYKDHEISNHDLMLYMNDELSARLKVIINNHSKYEFCSGVSSYLRAKIYERDNYCCVNPYCDTDGNDAWRSKLTIDHSLPATRGGENTEANCQTMCLGCNMRKNNKTMAEFLIAERIRIQ